MIASPRSPLRKPGTRCSVWMSATGTTPPIGPGTTEPAPQRIATALLVDYAGVMTRPIRECHRAWCDVEGVDGAALDEALRSWSSCTGAERSPLCLVETGAMPRWDFERELAGQLRRASGTWVEAEGLVDRMLAFFDPDPEMHSLVQRARTSGVRTGLVSNSWGSTQPWDDLRELFDTVVVSCAVGARKPELPIYEIAAARLDIPPAHCVFVDDFARNIDGAVATGMTGVHHLTVATTRRKLRRLFGDHL
jgi:putative hydrolase of the HAD superfamily